MPAMFVSSDNNREESAAATIGQAAIMSVILVSYSGSREDRTLATTFVGRGDGCSFYGHVL